MNRRVAFYTLGCKLNFAESSTIAREFEAGGFVRAARGERADICIINSCSVTGDADKKCRNIIRKASKENPGAIVAVTGCYAQLKPEEVAAIDGVDLVIGNNAKGTLVSQVVEFKGRQVIDRCDTQELTGFFAAFSSSDRTRTFLKVQDGCNYHCTYCTIPLARGASRNIPISDLVAQAEDIARRGQREIVLTGVNIGDFGRSTGETFLELIGALDKVEGIDRYRISSIEPNLLTDEIIAFCAASKRFMPHFHVPLQSGSNRVLGLMRRRYTTEKFAERLRAVWAQMPDAFVGVDVIVGFSGESDEDFEECYALLEGLKPAFLHIFPYSERANTPAAEFGGKVAPQVKRERVRRLEELSDRLHREFISRFTGSRRAVLVESLRTKQNTMFGYTDNYIRVELPFDKELINRIVDVTI